MLRFFSNVCYQHFIHIQAATLIREVDNNLSVASTQRWLLCRLWLLKYGIPCIVLDKVLDTSCRIFVLLVF